MLKSAARACRLSSKQTIAVAQRWASIRAPSGPPPRRSPQATRTPNIEDSANAVKQPAVPEHSSTTAPDRVSGRFTERHPNNGANPGLALGNKGDAGGNLERAKAATEKYVQTGKLDERYKSDARRVTALICSLPILIVTSYFLFQRRFGGAEQRHITVPQPEERVAETKGGGKAEAPIGQVSSGQGA